MDQRGSGGILRSRVANGTLGVEAPEEYVEDCASIVFPSPRASRLAVAWSPESIALVEWKMRDFDFLAGYTYDS